jgi:hypothetical protein
MKLLINLTFLINIFIDVWSLLCGRNSEQHVICQILELAHVIDNLYVKVPGLQGDKITGKIFWLYL